MRTSFIWMLCFNIEPNVGLSRSILSPKSMPYLINLHCRCQYSKAKCNNESLHIQNVGSCVISTKPTVMTSSTSNLPITLLASTVPIQSTSASQTFATQAGNIKILRFLHFSRLTPLYAIFLL